MADNFAHFADSPQAPATRAVAVSPHDGNALSDIPKALYVGGGGDLMLRGINDSADQLWKAVPTGTILPFRAQYVRATGTSATQILALY